MKAVYVQKGENLDFKNITEVPVEAGEVVVLGSRIGVAGSPIPSGEAGSIHMAGVYKLEKKTGEAVPAGANVFYEADGVTAVAGPAEDGTAGTAIIAGYTIAAAAADDRYAVVKIG